MNEKDKEGSYLTSLGTFSTIKNKFSSLLVSYSHRRIYFVYVAEISATWHS
jgi:hypothetical protein